MFIANSQNFDSILSKKWSIHKYRYFNNPKGVRKQALELVRRLELSKGMKTNAPKCTTDSELL